MEIINYSKEEQLNSLTLSELGKMIESNITNAKKSGREFITGEELYAGTGLEEYIKKNFGEGFGVLLKVFETEFIVTDEKSLKEAAEALGFGIIKKPKMIKFKPCSECGIRHNRTEQFTKEEYIPTGRDDAPRMRLNRYKMVKFYCNTCGKSVEKEFAVGRHFHISADQENEIRQMWNDIN